MVQVTNIHNVGIAVFGLFMLVLNNPFVSMLGLIFLAWGVGKSIHYYTYLSHAKTTDTRRVHLWRRSQ